MKTLRLIALLLLCAAAQVHAQAYPAKAVHIVVSCAAGGATDVAVDAGAASVAAPKNSLSCGDAPM